MRIAIVRVTLNNLSGMRWQKYFVHMIAVTLTLFLFGAEFSSSGNRRKKSNYKSVIFCWKSDELWQLRFFGKKGFSLFHSLEPPVAQLWGIGPLFEFIIEVSVTRSFLRRWGASCPTPKPGGPRTETLNIRLSPPPLPRGLYDADVRHATSMTEPVAWREQFLHIFEENFGGTS